MTQDEIIKSWIPMVEFIARTYGENCEVILHDLRDLDKSIVAIKNNHITGRQIGGTITDFALKLIHEKSWEERDFIINYKGRIPGKSENIRASTFFIKDEEGEIIAMLCMNVDLTSLSLAHKIIG
ncbi:helix-turn-helix transcriptional regulator, partial [Yersinia pestis]